MASQDPNERPEPRTEPTYGPQPSSRATATQRIEEEGAVQRAKETAGEAIDKAGKRAESAITQQKGRAAESLAAVADAIRKTGLDLRGQEHESLAGYAEKAAAQVERLGDTLRNREVGEIVDDVERFARRQPAVFLGGAFLLGVLAARFLKASERRAPSMDESYYPQTDYVRGETYGSATSSSPSTGGTVGTYPIEP